MTEITTTPQIFNRSFLVPIEEEFVDYETVQRQEALHQIAENVLAAALDCGEPLVISMKKEDHRVAFPTNTKEVRYSLTINQVRQQEVTFLKPPKFKKLEEKDKTYFKDLCKTNAANRKLYRKEAKRRFKDWYSRTIDFPLWRFRRKTIKFVKKICAILYNTYKTIFQRNR